MDNNNTHHGPYHLGDLTIPEVPGKSPFVSELLIVVPEKKFCKQCKELRFTHCTGEIIPCDTCFIMMSIH